MRGGIQEKDEERKKKKTEHTKRDETVDSESHKSLHVTKGKAA